MGEGAAAGFCPPRLFPEPSSMNVSVLQSAIVSEPSVEEVGLYEIRKKIYPRAVHGAFARWRWGLVFLTQSIFYLLPWLSWNGRQAVLFDLGARKFYIFGWVFWPQDVIYLAVLLIVAALSLFLFTAVAGRLWCGYACPRRSIPSYSSGSNARSKVIAALASASTRPRCRWRNSSSRLSSTSPGSSSPCGPAIALSATSRRSEISAFVE